MKPLTINSGISIHHEEKCKVGTNVVLDFSNPSGFIGALKWWPCRFQEQHS